MALNHRGISMVEIMITAVLIGFLGLSFAAIYVTANRFLIQDSTIILSQGDASFAVDHIRRKMMVANRLVVLTDQKAVFRHDPAFPGTPADFSDDVWAGYRLNGANLEFVPAVIPSTDTNGDGTADAKDDPIEADLDGATAEIPAIARGVVAPGGAIQGGTAPAIFALQGGSGTLLAVDLTVRKTAGKENRETRLRSSVSPRGINS